jgi:hypothetical protein
VEISHLPVLETINPMLSRQPRPQVCREAIASVTPIPLITQLEEAQSINAEAAENDWDFCHILPLFDTGLELKALHLAGEGLALPQLCCFKNSKS